MDSRRALYLKEMGVDVWVRRDPRPARQANAVAATAGSEEEVAVRPARRPDEPAEWERLEAEVCECKQCALHAARTQTVFGVGNPSADWLFVGEAPGAEEDRRGEPFVGRAGQLLTNMIRALGLDRPDVYIANILKCRPPGNRDPRPDESQACRPFLERQMTLIRPRVIVALGRIAAQNLLETDQPLGRLRGGRYQYGPDAIPLVVTYHPAYLLRSPLDKRKAWEDLLLARRLLAPHVQM